MARKGRGKEARFSFTGHVLMENRTSLVVDVAMTQATGTAERDTALEILGIVPGSQRITVGADKGYDTADFITNCRTMKVTPHVACLMTSKLDRRTTRHPGYCPSTGSEPAPYLIRG